MAQQTDFFRRVLGRFATGVTIATTRSQAGPAGLTVNSFTSVSLNPFLVLICVDLRSHTIPVFRAGGNFAVNILASDQESLANRFATHSETRATYFEQATTYIAATGAPILEHSLGFVDTRIVAEYPGGDHVIFLGQVEALGCDGEVAFLPGVDGSLCTLPTANQSNGNGRALPADTKPLLFYRGTYQHISNRFHHDLPDVPEMKEPAISNKEAHE